MFSCIVSRAILLLSLITYAVLAQETPCTIHDNGKYYDLNPLKSSKDYQIKTSPTQTISLNVCQNVKTDLFGLTDDSINAGDVGTFIRRGHGDFVLGKVNTTISVSDSRPRLVLSNGSRCKAKVGGQTTEIRASTVVEFVCDSSVYGAGSPRLVAQLPPGDEEVGCAYVLEWRTQYACPTSEGGGVWGFITTLAVIFLVLLMVYTALGVLYNRFVLQLRGFDQIPQFSIESMKYHGSEAWDWAKDIVSTFYFAGSGGNRNAGYDDMPSAGLPTTNPVSHHSQAAGLARDDDFGARADIDRGGFGNGTNFVRPQPSKIRPSPFQRADINPISHQSQVSAAQSLSFTSPSLPSAPAPRTNHDVPTNQNTASTTHGSTANQQDFMVGEEDEDAQELGDMHVGTVTSQTSSSVPSQLVAAHDAAAAPPSNGTQFDTAAASRGRDLGDGNVTRL